MKKITYFYIFLNLFLNVPFPLEISISSSSCHKSFEFPIYDDESYMLNSFSQLS